VFGMPVVFVTAHCEDGTLERIHEAVPGAPVLSKPVDRESLANAVSGACH
jgi:CheY-like chemotaxis protein